jgi:hypothetical protein
MAKFRTSKVGGSRKNTTYSTDKQFSYRSQDEQVERRKELLKGKAEQGAKEHAEIDMMSLDDEEYEKAMERLFREDAKNGTTLASKFWQTEMLALRATLSEEELDQYLENDISNEK